MDRTRDLASLAGEETIFGGSAAEKMERLQAELEPLSRRYDVVVANPPYMGSSNMNGWVSKWVKSNYPTAKSDLCTCFFERGQVLATVIGYISMITASSWMFISSFEKFRKNLLSRGSICSMIQQSTHGYAGVTVPTTMFAYACNRSGVIGSYIRLEDFDRPQWQEPRALEALANPDCGWFYRADSSGFKAIPGSPIAYWASNAVIRAFMTADRLDQEGAVKKGLTTSKDDLFVRKWHEVSFHNSTCASDGLRVGEGNKRNWSPLNKGGEYRKWYGNNDCVINWKNNGESVKRYPSAVIRNETYYFSECITWNDITSGRPSFRYKTQGHIFNDAGPSIFSDREMLLYILAFCNSSVLVEIAKIVAPTIHFTVGQMAEIPLLKSTETRETRVSILSKEHVFLARRDWDSFETSWDFAHHPLV